MHSPFDPLDVKKQRAVEGGETTHPSAIAPINRAKRDLVV